MDQAPRDIVHHARAMLAACVPIRVEHEVIHDQLTSSFEKITEGHGALRPVEYILLLDLYHGQLAPGLGQPVALMVELLFPGEQLLTSHKPTQLPIRLSDFSPVSPLKCDSSRSPPFSVFGAPALPPLHSKLFHDECCGHRARSAPLRICWHSEISFLFSIRLSYCLLKERRTLSGRLSRADS